VDALKFCRTKYFSYVICVDSSLPLYISITSGRYKCLLSIVFSFSLFTSVYVFHVKTAFHILDASASDRQNAALLQIGRFMSLNVWFGQKTPTTH